MIKKSYISKLSAPATSGQIHKDVHFADFVPRGVPLLWTHFTVSIRHFVKDYSLPIILSVVFLLIVLLVTFMRATQRTSLANLLAQVTSGEQGYGTLLSKDEAEQVKTNNDTEEPDAQVPEGAPSSLSFNNDSPTDVNAAPLSSGSNGGGADIVPQPVAVFSSSIASFQQNNVALECSTPKPKPQTCSKRYNFSASVRTQNGPGTVRYGWRSNAAGAAADSTFTVAAGEVVTPLQKSIILDCTSPADYSLQLVIVSPTAAQSASLSISHNCNDI